MSHKIKNLIRTLASEAEPAIRQLATSEQQYMGYRVANNVKQLHKQYDKNKKLNTILDKKKRLLNQIKEKLISNNAINSKADKGNFIVIIYQNTLEKYGLHPQQQLH